MNVGIQKSAKQYFKSGMLLLLVGSCLDNIRGPLIPLLTKDLGIDLAQASWILVLGNFLSVLMTFSLILILRFLSERQVSLFALTTTLLACLSTFFITSFTSLLVFAGLLGGGIGMLGAMSNVMALKGTNPENQSRSISALHMVYGLGSLLAPLLLAYGVNAKIHWSSAFIVMIPVLLVSLWYVKSIAEFSQDKKVDSPTKILFKSEHIIYLLTIGLYVAGEVMTSSWLATFLLEERGVSYSSAVYSVSMFFLVLTLVRLVVIFVVKQGNEGKMLVGSLILAMVFFAGGYWGGWDWMFPLAGLVGAFFPLFLSSLKSLFVDYWQSLTIWVMVFMQVFVGGSHWAMGRLIETYSVYTAFLLPMCCYAAALLLLLFSVKRLAPHG